MNGSLDEYRLEDIALDHRIGAGVFIPFVVARLQGESQATEAVLTVTLRNVGGSNDQQEKLRLFWSASSAPARPLGVPERTLRVRLKINSPKFDNCPSDKEVHLCQWR